MGAKLPFESPGLDISGQAVYKYIYLFSGRGEIPHRRYPVIPRGARERFFKEGQQTW